MIQLRGRSFETSLEMYKKMKHVTPPTTNEMGVSCCCIFGAIMQLSGESFVYL